MRTLSLDYQLNWQSAIQIIYLYLKNSNYVNILTRKQFLFTQAYFWKGGVAKFGVGEGGINKAYIFLYSSRLFLYSCIALSSPWMSPLCLFLGASCPSPKDLSRLILASSLNLLFSVFKFYKKVTLLLVQSNIPVCTYFNTSSNNYSFYWVLFVKKNVTFFHLNNILNF